MIFSYTELKRMLEFSEQHNKENIWLKTVNSGIVDEKYIQTQYDRWDEKDNFVDITDYSNL